MPANLDTPTTVAPSVTAGPFTLTMDPIAAFLNCELADHSIYDGIELQWFDDQVHGTGMLAFLSRRADRTVDYYAQPGLRLDPSRYTIGGGTRSWTTTTFDRNVLEIADDGVHADVQFTTAGDEVVEIHVDDRNGRRRRRTNLLAPVGSAITDPDALLLVWLRQFDLIRITTTPPTLRIGGQPVTTGRLPGTTVHRRHLIKYAGPLYSTQFNHQHHGPLDTDTDVAQLHVATGSTHATVTFEPPVPAPRHLPHGHQASGRWHLTIDDHRLTAGPWRTHRTNNHVRLQLDVDQPWRPGPQPAFMWLVTHIMPIFRRWPTTYRWRAAVHLGDDPALTSMWERTSSDLADRYRRTTAPDSAR